jgi:FHA domain
MPKLTLVMERTPIHVYELDRPVVQIGRSEGMEIVIDNVSVSRQQAEIRQDGRHWAVRDLGSSNGTFLNGKRLTEAQRLRPGDEISFGKFSLFYERQPAAPVVEAHVAPAAAKPRPPGTYHLSADEVERLQEVIATKRQAQLEWEIAGMKGSFYLGGDAVRLGPSKAFDLPVAGAPRRGLRFARGADGFEVENPAAWYEFVRMKVNGRATRRATLKTGDRIEVGELRLTFQDRIG